MLIGHRRNNHISRTSRFGERDLGWVSLDQLRGYASGTKKFVNRFRNCSHQ